MAEGLSRWVRETDPLSTMGLTLIVWLCSLVVVALVVLPLLGGAVAGTVAGVLLFVFFGICVGICSTRVPDSKKGDV